MSNDQIAEDAKVLSTRIPEGRRVAGLKYGAHVSQSMSGWCGYYVCIGDKWGVARMTPADDELVGDDNAIVAAIADELGD